MTNSFWSTATWQLNVANVKIERMDFTTGHRDRRVMVSPFGDYRWMEEHDIRGGSTYLKTKSGSDTEGVCMPRRFTVALACRS
jgi:hypothetical protein